MALEAPPRPLAPSTLFAILAVGLLLGLVGGLSFPRGSTQGTAAETQALRDEVARLNETLANLTAALERAREQARLAEVAASQAGVTEVSTRLAEVERLLGEGRRSDAFAPLQGLLVAAGNTSWAPLLQTEAEAVHENASSLYDRLSFGTEGEAAEALERLEGAVASLNELFREQYLPYHRSNPVGALVELMANLSGFFMDDGAGGLLRNPTLRLRAGATMLVEVTNTEALHHNFAIPSLVLITRNFGANETVGLIVGPAPAGDYRYFCDVPGHEATMNGHLVVAAAG